MKNSADPVSEGCSGCSGSCAVLLQEDPNLSGIKKKTLGIKARRIESPSSINTYKQCPRKYFYQYVMSYPTSYNVHTVLGGVCHSVLDRFFEQDIKSCTELDFDVAFRGRVQELLLQEWHEAKPKLAKIGVTNEQGRYYFEEAALMLLNWVDKFVAKIRDHPGGLHDAFETLTPVREKEYKSPSLSVRGFIDAIEKIGGQVRLMDYKTSKRFEINTEYKLQLSIYALMYGEEHGKIPSQVGIYFLKDPYQFEYILSVNQEMIDHARLEIEMMHLNSQSSNVVDYPKKVSGLCKWSTGQCDFYGRCFKCENL